MTGYILIQTEPGTVAEAARQIAEITGVISADTTSGYYDIIATARTEGVDELGMVAAAIEGVPGVTRRLVCWR